MRKRGEDISILSEKNCKTISDPYSRYEKQDAGIYKISKLFEPTEFRYNAVHLSFLNPTIGIFQVQTCCSDKRQSRPTRKKPFKHATRPACDISKV